MADEHSAKEAKFVALQEKKAEEAKVEVAIAKEEKIEAKAAEHQVKTETHKHEGKKEGAAPSKAGEKKAEPKKEEKKPAEKEAAKEEKKREIVLERIYTVPFSQIYAKPQQSRGNMAITFLRKFLARHMKGAPEKIKISLILNNTIRKRGSGRPMKKVKIKATKDKEGVVLAEIAA
ncbi:MAG TPA: 50S ribosomal protein L31e [Candidatus Norongarragalinales archaeon]|nr:50S ribosomal protein L31e [Candidatus Norongarragalinales archaeon]